MPAVTMKGPNEIIETQDGSHTIFSTRFGVSYHSKYGAIQESRHVFIKSGLFHKALTSKKLNILEIGLGTGLNAFITLLEAENHQLEIQFTAIEAFPISWEEAQKLNYPSSLDHPEKREQFLELHRCNWGEFSDIAPCFEFRKLKQQFEEISFSETFDLVYFDAFAPDAQPELWDLPVLSRVYNSMLPGGVLVTYCAKGVVKRRLRELGFIVERLPGPPGKREMTRATKPT